MGLDWAWRTGTKGGNRGRRRPQLAPIVNGYLEALETWGHVSANAKCWPEFDGKYVNYL